MRNLILFSVLVLFALTIGYIAGSKHIFNSKKQSSKRVNSLGGIFFKCKDPGKLKEWYTKHLGLLCDQYGACFGWRHMDDAKRKGFTVWSPFKENTSYFLPSQKEFMINYRVQNMDELLTDLKIEGIEPIDTVESFDYGKFVHIMDPEGNKIELWEPVDEVFEKMGKATF